jgi:small subunit ribosomal protein S3
MGQKTSPVGLRLQINRTWDSRWFAEGADYGRLLLEDLQIRRYIIEKLPQAAISKVVIERPAKICRVSIYAARPGVIIGKKGADIEKLKKELQKMTSSEVSLNIVEIRKPEIDAKLVAQGVADQLERRIAFRRAMKRAVQSALRLGAEGIRITCAGRLGGAEIARTEWYREGRVPLHTLRGNVDYAEAEAHTARLLELVGRRLEAQVELLALQLAKLHLQLVVGLLLEIVDRRHVTFPLRPASRRGEQRPSS